MKKSHEGYVLDKDGNVDATAGNAAVALSIIADKMPSSDTLRTDHPLQGQTFDSIANALEGIAEALNNVADAIKAHKGD